MRALLIGLLLLAGCGEVDSPAGVHVEGDGGAAGAMAGAGGGGSTGEAGTTGAGGAAGSGMDALPPSCAYTPEMVSGTCLATFNSAKATSVASCSSRMLNVTVDKGALTSAPLGEGSSAEWTVGGFSSTPDGAAYCAVSISFTRVTSGCGTEHIYTYFTLPSF